MLTTELNTTDVPALFSRFVSVIDDKHWMSQVRLCNEAIRGNRFLDRYLHSQYEIAYQLSQMTELGRRYGRIPHQHCQDAAIYPAIGFAVQVLSAVEGFGRVDGERFRRRVHGAFKNPADMRGLRLELSVATHFIRSGEHVRWPETIGDGNFDLFIESLGKEGLEIECKSVSDDKGRKVHRRESLDFFGLLKSHIESTISGLSCGLLAVLTLPGRLPTAYQDRLALAKLCGKAVFGGQDLTLQDGTNLRIENFSVDQLGTFVNGVYSAEDRIAIDRITRTRNREVMVVGTKAGGKFVFAMQSAMDDALLKTTFDTLSDAARKQLTGRRAGMLVAGFEGLGAEELRSIAAQDNDSSNPPTGLRLNVSRFLASDERDHVVGVGFFSGSTLARVHHGTVESGGLSYYFAKPESSFWSDDFRGILDLKGSTV